MKYKFDCRCKFAKAQFSFKIYFAALRLECKIYFAALRLECLLFCGFAIGMPVILQLCDFRSKFILRLCDWNACYFAVVRFSFQINFREGAID